MAHYRKPRYWMDLTADKTYWPVTILGVAFFLRMAYFFGFTRLESVGFWNLLVGLILPLAAEVAFIVLLRGLRYPKVNIYLLIGATLCATLLLQSFQFDSVLRIIVAVGAYLICVMAVLGVMLGYLTLDMGKWILFGTAAGRLLFFNLVQNVFGLHWITLIFEAAAIFDLAAVGFFVNNLRKSK